MADNFNFLTIDGEVYQVVTGGAQSSPDHRMGHTRRAWNGGLLSTEWGVKDGYTFTLDDMSQADYFTFKTLVESGVQTCSGKFFNGQDVSCNITISSAVLAPTRNNDHVWIVTISIVEA